MYSLGGLLSNSKDRLKTTVQNNIRHLYPKILKNKEIFPNGQLKSSDIFKNQVRNKRVTYINLINSRDGQPLTNEELEVMGQVIEYYKKKKCIYGNRLKLSLSSDLFEYLNQIKKELQSVQQEQINMQEDNTPQQINPPTQISPPPGGLSTYNPIIPTQTSPPPGALSTYNPIISTTLPPQSTVPKTNTRQQLGSSRIPESGPVPNNPIYKTRQIQRKFRENTGNP